MEKVTAMWFRMAHGGLSHGQYQAWHEPVRLDAVNASCVHADMRADRASRNESHPSLLHNSCNLRTWHITIICAPHEQLLLHLVLLGL